MTVSIDKTAKKYHGRKAETYDAIRTKQERWDLENKIVAAMLLPLRPKTVLDMPVGTGRFLKLYADTGVAKVTGVDVSSSMIDLARKASRRITKSKIELIVGDALSMGYADKMFDCSVCVRFLDLIDEAAMQGVVRELCRVSRRAIITTIRFGEKYVPKSNTAEHDRKKFMRLIDRQGWRVVEDVPIFNAGWTVLKMERK
jgi:ubiquinone/menaquinone biosynthesis C-methylase UbiE